MDQSAFLKNIQAVHDSSKLALGEKHDHAVKYLAEKKVDLDKIRQHSTKLLTAGVLAGTLMLNSPHNLALAAPALSRDMVKKLTDARLAIPTNPQDYFIEELKAVISDQINNLTSQQEREIGFLIERITGIKARASLEGEKLNTSLGFIGAEQHLPRFPGDNVGNHDEYQKSGITPGLGAWGYFTQSQIKLSKEDVLKEKYYVAVQTLYLPDWEKRLPYLRDWYKHRKVIVVNPKNGQAVVAVIGDSGPAAWTGKQFGGSPEVMALLDLNKGMQKGQVIMFLVDDPENKVPLGPVDFQNSNLPKVEISQS
jgi:hypothetical protein